MKQGGFLMKDIKKKLPMFDCEHVFDVVSFKQNKSSSIASDIGEVSMDFFERAAIKIFECLATERFNRDNAYIWTTIIHSRGNVRFMVYLEQKKSNYNSEILDSEIILSVSNKICSLKEFEELLNKLSNVFGLEIEHYDASGFCYEEEIFPYDDNLIE